MTSTDQNGTTLWDGALRHVRRILIVVVGSTLLLFGAVMLVTPGPGWLLIFAGLSVLGLEFVWARRLLRKAKRKANEARRRLFGSDQPALR